MASLALALCSAVLRPPPPMPAGVWLDIGAPARAGAMDAGDLRRQLPAAHPLDPRGLYRLSRMGRGRHDLAEHLSHTRRGEAPELCVVHG